MTMSTHIEKRVNHTYLCLWMIILFSTMSSTGFGGGFCRDLALEVNPPIPNSTVPITITVHDVCSDSCFRVCNVIGEWVSDTEFHIDWYFIDNNPCIEPGCLTEETPHSSEFNVGVLKSGNYVVTSSLYLINACDGKCMEGALLEETELPFEIGPPIPAVSQWGLVTMTLMILITGTIILGYNLTLILWKGE